MRIGLIAERYIDGDLDFNFFQMSRWLSDYSQQGCDLLCFGESFAHGFEALCWQQKHDIRIALTQDDKRIQQLAKVARENETGIGFGYIEREGRKLFSSYMVISSRGDLLFNFRRVSPGWKTSAADSGIYLEGSSYDCFQLNGKTIGAAICGDLWHDDLLLKFNAQPSELLLWPLYVSYTPEYWYGGERDAYAQRVASLNRPVLMINSISDPPDQAFGGAYVFDSGRISQELPLGQSGILIFES